MQSGEGKWQNCVSAAGGTEAGNPNGAGRLPTPEERIALARLLWGRFGHRLQDRVAVQRLLSRLEKGICRSWDTMQQLGITDDCARCDAEAPEGSCCSAGLENKVDTVLLLINLLLGVELRGQRSREGSCFFLGDHGCTLKARHMLCIDYLCPAVERRLGTERLRRMQLATGEEIEALFLLEEEIRVLVSSWLEQR